MNELTPGQVWSQLVRRLPDYIFDQMLTTKESLSDLRWAMGWQAVSCYQVAVANKLPFTRAQVCAAIAHFYDDIRSMSSVMRFMEVAGFYQPEVVEAYSILPFSHFEYAMRLGARWRSVLDYSIKVSDERGGQPPSVVLLERKFEPEHFQQQADATAPGRSRAGSPDPGNVLEASVPDWSYLPAETAPAPDIHRIRSYVSELVRSVPGLRLLNPCLAQKLAQVNLLFEEILSELSNLEVPND